MRTEQMKTYLASGMFATCPSYMEGLIATVNSGEVAKETIEGISPSHSYDVQGNVAIITVDGAMTKKNTWMNAMCGGFTSYDILSEYIAKAEKDTSVDTILFDVDTAGGEVAGADEVGELIFASSKKTVTFYNNLGASAGIWIFSASKEIYANRTAMIGSIGVLAGYRDDKGENNGSIKLVSKNAQNKDCSLNGDCKQKIQARIDDVEKIFYERVMRNTNLSAQEIAGKFGYGDVVSAQEAKDAGFIKDITTLDSIIKSLKSSSSMGSTFVPTASASANLASDNSNEINQGADMKFDRENLDETEATFNALVANRDTMTSRNDSLTMKLETATTALEAKTEEVQVLTAQLSEAEGNFKAEIATRVEEAITTGVDAKVILAMVNAETAEDASKIALEAKSSDGGTHQSDADATQKKQDAEKAYAMKVAKKLSV